jgi:DNA-binding response OmpR family regulator
MVVQALDDAGFAFCEAGDANSAMAVLSSNNDIRLMITDVGLPGLNGRQIADAGRTVRPDLKILFMTGYADRTRLEDPLPPGMDLITKPFDLDDLAARATALIEG